MSEYKDPPFEPTKHQVDHLYGITKTHMARLSARVQGGSQAIVLQLLLCEMETLKSMLFDPDTGPLAGRDLAHAYGSLLVFNSWAEQMTKALQPGLHVANGIPYGPLR